MRSDSLATRSSARDSVGVRIPGAGVCFMTTRGQAHAGGVYRTVAVIAYGPDCTVSVGERDPIRPAGRRVLGYLQSRAPHDGGIQGTIQEPVASMDAGGLESGVPNPSPAGLARGDGSKGLDEMTGRNCRVGFLTLALSIASAHL